MNKRDVLRLKSGDQILYGDSKWTAKCRFVEYGEVLGLKPSGHVNVRPLGRIVDDDAEAFEKPWPPKSVPHPRIIKKRDVRRIKSLAVVRVTASDAPGDLFD